MATGGEPPPGCSEDKRESLTCSLCLGIFINPKLLPCSHSYCLKCLEDLTSHYSSATFACPQCRRDVTIPAEGVSAFQTNFYIHPGDLADARNEELCLTHPRQVLDLFCVDCQQPVCLKCVLTKHKIHTTQDVSEAAVKARDQLREHSSRLEKSVTLLMKEVEQEKKERQDFKTKKTAVERDIQSKHAELVAMADKYRDEVLVTFQTLCQIQDNDSKIGKLQELQELQQRVKNITSKGTPYAQVCLAREIKKEKVDFQSVQNIKSRDVIIFVCPDVVSCVTRDTLEPQVRGFFGSVDSVKRMAMRGTQPKMALKKAADSDTKEQKVKPPPPQMKEPDMKYAAPEMKLKAPEIKSTSPGMKLKAPEMTSVPSGMELKAPEIKSTSPEMKMKAPDMKSTPHEMKSSSTKMESSSPETKAPEMKSSSPDMKSASREMKLKSPEMKSSSPGIKSASPETKAPEMKFASPKTKAPEMKSSSPPDMKSASPEMKSTPPEMKSVLPETKAPKMKSPEVKSTPPETKSSSPEMKAPKMKSASPETKATEMKSSSPPDMKSASPEMKLKPPEMKSTPPEIKSSSPEMKAPKMKSASPETKATEMKSSSSSDMKSASLEKKAPEIKSSSSPDMKSASPETPEMKAPDMKSTSSEKTCTTTEMKVEASETKFVIPDMKVVKEFTCRKEEDTEVYCVCPLDTGQVCISYACCGGRDDMPSDLFQGDGQYVRASAKAVGKSSLRCRAKANPLVLNSSDLGICSYPKSVSNTNSHLRLINEKNGKATIEKETVESDVPLRTSSVRVCFIKIGVHRAFDVNASQMRFAVVVEPHDRNTSREVRLYRPFRENAVATYTAPGTHFNPSDVCFYFIGGKEVLLIADESGDGSVHVVNVQFDHMVFLGYLASQCPQLRQPTALNVDQRGRLWVACRGGTILIMSFVGHNNLENSLRRRMLPRNARIIPVIKSK